MGCWCCRKSSFTLLFFFSLRFIILKAELRRVGRDVKEASVISNMVYQIKQITGLAKIPYGLVPYKDKRCGLLFVFKGEPFVLRAYSMLVLIYNISVLFYRYTILLRDFKELF